VGVRTAIRYKSLDALRGIAAFTVVLHHVFNVFPQSESFLKILDPENWIRWEMWLRYSPLRTFVGGRPAVVLFFVMSGFVLAIQYEKSVSVPYGEFILKRFCRIYLPFLAALLFAASLATLTLPVPVEGLSHWFNEKSWTAMPTAEVIMRHLVMTGIISDMQLNNVMWSLVHELRISFVFPLIAAAVLMFKRRSAVLFGGMWIISEFLGRMVTPDGFAASLFDSVGYVLFFAVGASCYFHRQVLIRLTARVHPGVVIGMAIVLMALPPGVFGAELVYGVASVALIGLSISNKSAVKVLETKPLLWLGQVSYSLYLFHLPILLLSFDKLYGRVHSGFIVVLVIGLSLIAAWIACLTIERPAMRLGRALTGRLKTA
jgi:peptidoglycan/LPS O-acetylase OafA/YrhL